MVYELHPPKAVKTIATTLYYYISVEFTLRKQVYFLDKESADLVVPIPYLANLSLV